MSACDASVWRILDANANRAREALRVIEDHARFGLDDVELSGLAKRLRHDLAGALAPLPRGALLAARDTPGDVGTRTSTPAEHARHASSEVAIAAAKRLTEALRTIEEYGKTIDPAFAGGIEQLRYRAYDLEKRMGMRLRLGDRFAGVRLYVLLTASLCRRPLLDVVRGVLDGGADCVQLREKQLEDDELLALAKQVRELTRRAGRPFILNDRPDIAALAHADGVHLGQSDLPIAAARRIVGPDLLIGRSTHSLHEARQAVDEGADYIAVGPMFETSTKVRPVVGPELLTQVTGEVSLPIVAIGGIKLANLEQVIGAGAGSVAVCTDIIAADDPRGAARAFADALAS